VWLARGRSGSQNGGVYVSTETITTIISAAALLLSFAAAFGWMINRSDKQSAETRRDLGERISGVEHELGKRISGVEHELGKRIGGVERELGKRISGVEHELGKRISGVERELVEVKIAIARIEGPPRHLAPLR